MNLHGGDIPTSQVLCLNARAGSAAELAHSLVFSSRKVLTRKQIPVLICAMRNKTFALILAVCFLAAGASSAKIFNPQISKWKLNPGKSNLRSEMGRNDLVDYEWSLNKIKVTISGVDGQGHALHSVWKGNFDGQDYAVTGDPMSDTRSYQKINDRTLDFTVKKGGKMTATGRIVVAPDGNSRTVTTWAKNSRGRKITSIAVYDKVKLF
jgi:hypothetical protein